MPFDVASWKEPVVVEPFETRVLRYALGLIEKGWCKRAFATTVEGLKVCPLDKRAASFCASGAIERSTVDLSLPPFIYDRASKVLVMAVGVEITLWNDHTDNKELVVAGFRRAISLSISKAREAREKVLLGA